MPDNADLYDIHEEDKRNWAKFNGGWGKRSNWNNFRGMSKMSFLTFAYNSSEWKL